LVMRCGKLTFEKKETTVQIAMCKLKLCRLWAGSSKIAVCRAQAPPLPETISSGSAWYCALRKNVDRKPVRPEIVDEARETCRELRLPNTPRKKTVVIGGSDTPKRAGRSFNGSRGRMQVWSTSCS
jgi:hypothetical protein